MKIFLYIQAATSCLMAIVHGIAKLLGSNLGNEHFLHPYTVMIVCMSAIWIHDAVVAQKAKS